MRPNLPGSLPIHLRSALPTATMEPKHAGNDTSVGGISPKRLFALGRSEQALQCTITAIFSQSRHAALTGASLNTIVEFGLVFLPVLACPCSQLLHIAFNGTSRKKEHVFYGTRNSEVV
jgi:hypothetical protein